eukprot:TCONS_00024084-protein
MAENIGEEESEVKSIEEELALDLKSFLTVDVSKQKEEIDTLISGVLAKLEEFCQVIENIRTESKDVLFTIAPVLHERCMETKPLFQQIDDLERFIGVVHNAVDDAENKVKIAEKELGSKNIKKILHNVPVPKFLQRKKEIQPYLKREVQGKDYEKPIGFKTEDYFEASFHLLPDDQLVSSTEEESND